MDTKKLRQKILDLAIHGKLVPQDPNDEPASVLLERIRAEKERLIAEGKIKRSKKSATSDTSHYENVPFEIPEEWCWCRLDCVGEIVTGSTPSKDNVDYYGGSVPFYKPTDLEQGINTIEASDSLTELGFSVSRQLPSQSILVTCIGATIGKTGLIQKRGTCNQQINAIISNEMVLPEYLYYTCISGYMQNEIIGRASATTLPILNKNKFSEVPIPVPPIQEQHRIISKIKMFFSFVKELENSDKELIGSISTAKSKILDLAIHGKLVPQDANDEPASELLKRINPKAIASCDNPHYAEPYELPDGWTWCKLIDICTFLSRGKSPKYSETDTTYPVFAQKCNLKEGGISLEKAQFLEPTTLKRWPDVYHLQTGDVLVNSTGTGTVGRTRLFNESCLGNFPFVVPDSHVSVIRTHGEIVSEYIFALMSSSWIQTYLEDNLAGSTNQKELYIGVLQNVDVPLPPVMEQTRIADKIESLYQQLDNIANHIE